MMDFCNLPGCCYQRKSYAEHLKSEQPAELTPYQKELAWLTAMFPNGCPICPSKLPPDPRDGRCGMCGAVLVERKAASDA